MNSKKVNENLAGRMKSKFHRVLGSNTCLHTKIVDECEPKILRQICEIFSPQPDEMLALVCWHDEDNWVVATSCRIAIMRDGIFEEVNIVDIQTMGWSNGPSYLDVRKKANEFDLCFEDENGQMRSSKQHSPWFFICDDAGKRHEILLEAGFPVAAFYNAIALGKNFHSS